MLKSLQIDEAKLKSLQPRQRDIVVGYLRDLDYLREHNPLALYFPHSKQHIYHSFNKKEVPIGAFFGGTQSGKTTGGLADDVIQALPEDDLPTHLRDYKRFQPPFLCRILSPTEQLLETVIYEKLRELIPWTTLEGDSWSSAFDHATRSLHFKCGSKFFFLTYKQDPQTQGGQSVDRTHYDEEPPEGHRTEGRFRVMARGGDERFTMTPTEGLTWTYDKIWKQVGGEEDPDAHVYFRGDIAVVRVDMDDNPALGETQKRIALEGLSSEERHARKEGRFVALHGLIYQEFRRERHVIPQIDAVPENCNIVVGIDPGIRNRAAVVWGYLAPNDVMVVFEEGYFEGFTVRAVSERIHAVNELYGITPLYYVIDPAAQNRAHQTGRSDQMEYADHGIVAIAGQHAVPAGINRVKERLETTVEGEPRLQITANCRHLIEEMMQYRWKEPPRSGEDGAQRPVKKADHLLDALRYLIMSRPYLPEVSMERQETELQRMKRESEEGPDEIPQSEFGGVFL